MSDISTQKIEDIFKYLIEYIALYTLEYIVFTAVLLLKCRNCYTFFAVNFYSLLLKSSVVLTIWCLISCGKKPLHHRIPSCQILRIVP